MNGAPTAVRTAGPQRGVALIIALLVAALAAAVAISLATAQSQWSAQVAQRRDHVQAQSIALAGIQWTRQILDAARNAPYNHLGDPWAMPLPATPVENGSVEGRIVDAQGMLNVNGLANAAQSDFARQRFQRLFDALHVAPATLAALVDWVDADNVENAGGAEDAWYQRQATPGLAASMPALRVQELGDVRGVSAPVLDGLARFVTTLPADAALNVNTAPPETLTASIVGMEGGAVAALIASRSERPFASVAALRERLPPGAALIGPDAMYTVKSRYFLVHVRARQGDTITDAHALIDRDGNGWPSIVWQTIE